MRKLVFVLAMICSLSLITFEAQAKKDKKAKEEEKKWKKELKGLDWEDYKKLIEKKEAAETDKADYLSQLDALDAENTNLKNQNSQLKANISQMQDKLDNQGPIEVEPQPVQKSSDNFDKGVVFRVQIGAFKNLGGASTYSESNDNFGAESDGDTDKYTIGAFREYNDADLMKKYLRKMGVKDAWIASYKNGQRVSIKDVADHIK